MQPNLNVYDLRNVNSKFKIVFEEYVSGEKQFEELMYDSSGRMHDE
ncbi:MAG: hypothetical protein ACK5LT_13985 [Lachnospirales bacterium]